MFQLFSFDCPLLFLQDDDNWMASFLELSYNAIDKKNSNPFNSVSNKTLYAPTGLKEWKKEISHIGVERNAGNATHRSVVQFEWTVYTWCCWTLLIYICLCFRTTWNTSPATGGHLGDCPDGRMEQRQSSWMSFRGGGEWWQRAAPKKKVWDSIPSVALI